MRSFLEYGKKIRGTAALAGVILSLDAVVSLLYGLPLEPLFYTIALCLAAGGVFFFYGYRAYRKKEEMLRYVSENWKEALGDLPPAADGCEALYQEMLNSLNRERMEAGLEHSRFFTELTDYYTMWVHQIKTPISAMRLLLQEPVLDRGSLTDELFRIEQYVEMVLGYLRTEDMSSDMKFALCSLDDIIRGQIHKYARIFVGKKICLEYSGVDAQVLTDEKWLGFVIGQILSNSLKYTAKGKISISMSPDQEMTLVIRDTGQGIRAEDLPRIFEKGFTGTNGRAESHSTGIGLYLSRKIAARLHHGIAIESREGEGTAVFLSLGRTKIEI